MAGEVTAPLVFQCKSCRCILGDSFYFLSSDETMMTLTLTAAAEAVQVDTELVTSSEGKDLGSSFRRLRCRSCQAVVGRMYCTTPRHLDALRDSFTFDVRLMTSYQFGTGMASAADSGSAVPDTTVTAPPELKTLETDILRIQQMLVGLYERVDDMETHLRVHFPDLPMMTCSQEMTVVPVPDYSRHHRRPTPLSSQPMLLQPQPVILPQDATAGHEAPTKAINGAGHMGKGTPHSLATTPVVGNGTTAAQQSESTTPAKKKVRR